MGYSELLGVIEVTGVTRDYKCNRGLHRVKDGNKGLQEVLRDYSEVRLCGMAY